MKASHRAVVCTLLGFLLVNLFEIQSAYSVENNWTDFDSTSNCWWNERELSEEFISVVNLSIWGSLLISERRFGWFGDTPSSQKDFVPGVGLNPRGL
jgi:hypothetical protein